LAAPGTQAGVDPPRSILGARRLGSPPRRQLRLRGARDEVPAPSVMGVRMGAVAWMVLAYFAGSIPFGVLVTHWRSGLDVRQHGSGNIGATNVARVAGKGVGIAVLLLDA